MIWIWPEKENVKCVWLIQHSNWRFRNLTSHYIFSSVKSIHHRDMHQIWEKINKHPWFDSWHRLQIQYSPCEPLWYEIIEYWLWKSLASLSFSIKISGQQLCLISAGSYISIFIREALYSCQLLTPSWRGKYHRDLIQLKYRIITILTVKEAQSLLGTKSILDLREKGWPIKHLVECTVKQRDYSSWINQSQRWRTRNIQEL